ncbi:cell division cycle 20.1, cofactor of APC complex-like isoform X2 [Limulus polyphemus]|nr:cell division cycle 20.1, cofactor of APC complex-like isoform X2 [Limulus polyphemus]XP_022242650.1 cell division cycle 20.1, cofactor of APC complex-like isoform X2 [Limulus polyphemus]XP_022242651.1 cell division cycle 20.1, cofactor of APC complex-like isoform X2 [Limulus polyphemus]
MGNLSPSIDSSPGLASKVVSKRQVQKKPRQRSCSESKKVLLKKEYLKKSVILKGKDLGSPSKKQDRFIPNRSTTNMEYAYFKIFGEDCSLSQQGNCMYRQVLTPPEPAMFSFRTKEKAVSASGLETELFAHVYSITRSISLSPEKVLEAPDILTDFNLHLLDWSSTPLLAVALDKQLHLWDSQDEKAMHLLELSDEGYICSVKWATTDPILAVGLNSGSVEV